MPESLAPLFVPSHSRHRVTYDVVIDISSEVDEAASCKVNELIKTFVAAGAHGGFPPSNATPGDSRLAIESSDLSISGGMSFILNANLVDLRAFQLLRNSSCRLAREDINVTRIVVKEIGQSDHQLVKVPEADYDNESDVYPGIASIKLATMWEDNEFSKLRRCVVEKKDPVGAVGVLGIRDWIEPWYQLLEAGAFAMPVGRPDETVSIGGSVSFFDEFSIEISVGRFLASESAWSVLINMLDAYSSSSGFLLKVTID